MSVFVVMLIFAFSASLYAQIIELKPDKTNKEGESQKKAGGMRVKSGTTYGDDSKNYKGC